MSNIQMRWIFLGRKKTVFSFHNSRWSPRFGKSQCNSRFSHDLWAFIGDHLTHSYRRSSWVTTWWLKINLSNNHWNHGKICERSYNHKIIFNRFFSFNLNFVIQFCTENTQTDAVLLVKLAWTIRAITWWRINFLKLIQSKKRRMEKNDQFLNFETIEFSRIIQKIEWFES